MTILPVPFCDYTFYTYAYEINIPGKKYMYIWSFANDMQIFKALIDR